jgi:hypothetical protein
MLRAFFLSLALISSAACFAQGGPPMITDDPGTPGNGHWEINLGFTQETLSGQNNFAVPDLDVNYGAGDHLQINFEIPILLQASGGMVQFGLGNSKLGLKWRFLDQDKTGVNVSTYPHLIFNNPTNSVRNGLADEGSQVFLPIEISRQFQNFEIGAEVGINFQQHRPNELWFGVAGGYDVREGTELLAEIHTIRGGGENESVFDLGSRVHLSRLNTLLLAAGRALPGSTASLPRFFLYAGLQFSF